MDDGSCRRPHGARVRTGDPRPSVVRGPGRRSRLAHRRPAGPATDARPGHRPRRLVPARQGPPAAYGRAGVRRLGARRPIPLPAAHAGLDRPRRSGPRHPGRLRHRSGSLPLAARGSGRLGRPPADRLGRGPLLAAAERLRRLRPHRPGHRLQAGHRCRGGRLVPRRALLAHRDVRGLAQRRRGRGQRRPALPPTGRQPLVAGPADRTHPGRQRHRGESRRGRGRHGLASGGRETRRRRIGRRPSLLDRRRGLPVRQRDLALGGVVRQHGGGRPHGRPAGGRGIGTIRLGPAAATGPARPRARGGEGSHPVAAGQLHVAGEPAR